MLICKRFGWMVLLTGLAISTACAAEDGFTSLLNGKNLDGWVSENCGDVANFTVEKGELHCRGIVGPPAWLRSDKTYENYDLRFDFMVKGWTNGGLFFNAPLHGRQSLTGFCFQIYHDRSTHLTPNITGSIFAVVPPKINMMKANNQWNTGRILLDWPALKIWVNDELVQDLNVEENPELKYRLRRGYLGIQDAGYNVWFKNMRIEELPDKEEWITLFNGKNFDGWYIEGKGVKWTVQDGIIHAEENGSYLVSNDTYEDFELFTYVRTCRNANGGIFFRWNTLVGGDRGYEIQIENVPDSPHPTGSLYNVVRAIQPRYIDEEWFPMQIRVQGSHVVVRVNGETTVDYNELTIIRPGHISLQMHHEGKWVEWKDIRIKK